VSPAAKKCIFDLSCIIPAPSKATKKSTVQCNRRTIVVVLVCSWHRAAAQHSPGPYLSRTYSSSYVYSHVSSAQDGRLFHTVRSFIFSDASSATSISPSTAVSGTAATVAAAVSGVASAALVLLSVFSFASPDFSSSGSSDPERRKKTRVNQRLK
jgi:hypothetical protein